MRFSLGSEASGVGSLVLPLLICLVILLTAAVVILIVNLVRQKKKIKKIEEQQISKAWIVDYWAELINLNTGEKFRINEGKPCVIGREKGMGFDIVVRDSAVSAQHAKVWFHRDGYDYDRRELGRTPEYLCAVQDLGSRNGTAVLESADAAESVILKEGEIHSLKSGNCIRVGRTVFWVHYPHEVQYEKYYSPK